MVLSLLMSSQFRMLASLNSQHSLRPAVGLNVFKPQHNLLGNCRLFLENQFSLSTVATLLLVIMLLSLGTQRVLAFPVLGDWCLPYFLQKV